MVFEKPLLTALLFCVPLAATALPARAAQPRWQASVPAVVGDAGAWNQLVNELRDKGFHTGALAAAARSLMFFTSLDAKENAYKTILEVVDRGYPYPVLSYFQAGDLSPSGDYDLVNSYNLYKAVLNHQRGLEKWAKQYMEGVDTAKFRKYVFLEALDAYGKRDYAKAEQKLKGLLGPELDSGQKAFARKVARTLARLYFDQEQYARALDLYSGFLLRLDPVDPHDWLEAAWCLYYLKRAPEALGMLYNLESRAAESVVNLEKYTLRALIYRSQCAVNPADELVQSFQKEFGETLEGLKRGKPVSALRQLALIESPTDTEYNQLNSALSALRQESVLVDQLAAGVRNAAAYLYRTEIAMLTRKIKPYATAVQEKAAIKLIMMDENLRFLKFAVQREKYNPDTVFKGGAEARALSAEAPRIRWRQHGDYWRDERLNYEGVLPNRCYD